MENSKTQPVVTNNVQSAALSSQLESGDLTAEDTKMRSMSETNAVITSGSKVPIADSPAIRAWNAGR